MDRKTSQRKSSIERRRSIMETTLVILKPDCVNRNLLGEVIHRFEQKGLKIIGMKLHHLSDKLLDEHYAHLKDKPFFPKLKTFMQHAPSLLIALQGADAVAVVRAMAGVTNAREALPGTIRGDYAMSIQANIIHASEDQAQAKAEVTRFFKQEELFNYEKIDLTMVYAEDERGSN
jgi:nucleoside-diphosphate kinase